MLSDSAGRLIDRVTIENVPVDYSVGLERGRLLDVFSAGDPRVSQYARRASKVDQLIRRFQPVRAFTSQRSMVSNDSIAIGATGLTADYIELYNSSAVAVDLSNYGLSDNLGQAAQMAVSDWVRSSSRASTRSLPSTGKRSCSSYYELHTNFKLSKTDDNVVSFCDPTGKVLDRIPIPSDIPTDHSYGRSLGYAGFYYYFSPTPGTPLTA